MSALSALFSALLGWAGWGGSGGSEGGRAPLGVAVGIIPAVLLAHHPATTVSHLPNEAGLQLLGQMISRGLFVLHTLMLFNSKFLIKWKVLLAAREQCCSRTQHAALT